jgi:hypothetical protein
MTTPKDVQCGRIARILKEAGQNYDIVFDDQQGDYIRFTVKHVGTVLLNPTSGHLRVEEIATKSDDAVRQLLTNLSHGLITF